MRGRETVRRGRRRKRVRRSIVQWCAVGDKLGWVRSLERCIGTIV